MQATQLYADVTNQVIAMLEKGTRPWVKPWHGDHAAGRITQPLRWNGQPYSGANVIVLWITAEAKGYNAPLWLTFKQTRELGGHVKAGEKAAHVIYCNTIKSKDEEKEFFFARTYSVFNACQTTGLPAHYYATTGPVLDPVHRDAQADAFIARTGAKLAPNGTSAHYNKETDTITMPPFAAFADAEAFYSTYFHELAHWTGHESRLKRELKGRNNIDSYAFEELVAEVSSAFTSVSLDVIPQPREENASYVAHWLDILKGDTRAIFKAAALAQKATDYLKALQPGE